MQSFSVSPTRHPPGGVRVRAWPALVEQPSSEQLAFLLEAKQRHREVLLTLQRLSGIHPRALSISLELQRSSTFQQRTASKQGNPEACRWLQEGLVSEAWMDELAKVGLERVAGRRALGWMQPLCLWLWHQLPLLLLLFALLLFPAVQLL